MPSGNFCWILKPEHPVKIILTGLFFFLKGIVIVLIQVFYPRIARINLHLFRHKGPAIIIFNHPNTLLDPLLAAAHVRGVVYFLANYSMFKHPVSAWLLNHFFCIPIQRPSDTQGEPLQNDASFARATEHLAKGGKLLIAAEGGSIIGRRIRPFKTGAARIAFQTEAVHNFKTGLVFLPIGLSYENQQNFGGSVVLHAGTPIQTTDFADAWKEDPRQAVRDLTELLENRLRELAIHTHDEAEDKLLHRAEILLQNSFPLPLKASYFRTRRLVAAFHDCQEQQPEVWERFSRDLRAYFARMSALGLHDHALIHPSFRFLILHICALLAVSPVLLTGWLFNAIPFHLPGILAKRFKASPEYMATWKTVSGLLIFPGYYFLMYHLLKWWLNPALAGIFTLFSFPLGLIAWHIFRWGIRIRQRFFAWRQFQTNPEMKREWQELRNHLLQSLQAFTSEKATD